MQLHAEANHAPADGGAFAAAPEQQGSHTPARHSTSGDGNFREDDPLFMSVDFRMYCYKVLPCTKRFCHDWSTCPFAHFSERAKRRDPRVVKYTAIACPEMKKGEDCPRGDKCPYAHNVFEYWLHPTRYRTRMCRDGASCGRKVCFFAHKPDELRVPASRPSLPVADDGWDGFGSEDSVVAEAANETIAKVEDAGNNAAHRRALSVPLEFLAGLSEQAADTFQVEHRPHRAYSMSENHACELQGPGSAVNQLPQLPTAVDGDAERLTRALLAKLSLSSLPEAHQHGQPAAMQLPPHAPSVSFPGTNPAALPLMVSTSSPASSMGAAYMANSQVLDFQATDPFGAGFQQEALHRLCGEFQGVPQAVPVEGMANVGVCGVEGLLRALLALQSQQHCGLGLGSPRVDCAGGFADVGSGAALLQHNWQSAEVGAVGIGGAYYPQAPELQGISGLM